MSSDLKRRAGNCHKHGIICVSSDAYRIAKGRQRDSRILSRVPVHDSCDLYTGYPITRF